MSRMRREARALSAALALSVLAAASIGAEPSSTGAQVGPGLTIEACREKARAHYPLARQYELIDRTKGLDLAIAKRGYLPRLGISGKASYQSDATSLDSIASSLPPQIGSALEGVGADKDQYQALAELSVSIWDGGAIEAQVKGIESATRVDRSKLDVDMYALDDKVDQLFFGILSIREQLKQNDILLGQLGSSYDRVEASLRNGVASPYDLDAVRVEILNAKQRGTELAAGEKAYREMLSELLGAGLPEGTAFEMPDASGAPAGDDASARPEIALFAAQERQLESQEAAIRAANMPRLSAFFQEGYGKPGLNMFESGFSDYWIGGIKLSWSLNGFLDWKAQREKIDDSRRRVAAQRDAFLQGNAMQVARLRTEVEKLRGLLGSDDEIIALREGMRKSTEGKQENGAATTDDVIKAIDAENLARRARSLHEVQLAAAVYALKSALAR
jgi:outer membrane protein TolC